MVPKLYFVGHGKSPIQHEEPIIGSLYWPYRETDMSGFGYYLWWAFCIKNLTADVPIKIYGKFRKIN